MCADPSGPWIKGLFFSVAQTLLYLIEQGLFVTSLQQQTSLSDRCLIGPMCRSQIQRDRWKKQTPYTGKYSMTAQHFGSLLLSESHDYATSSFHFLPVHIR